MKTHGMIALLIAAIAVLFVGCQGEEQTADAEQSSESESQQADATSRPTEAIATTGQEWAQALSAEGPWIIIATENVETDQELVVEGEVYEEEGAEAPRRKLALYAQDSERNVTDRYTLTTPRLIVRHENVRVQGGTIDGDVYVEAEGFQLQDATVDGNVYFESEALRESAEIDEASTVTGSVEIGTL